MLTWTDEVLRNLEILGAKVDGFERKFMERKFEIEMERLRIESNERANQLENNFKLEMQKLESNFKIEMEKLRNEHNERTSELEKKFMGRTYEMERKFEVEMEKIRNDYKFGI